MPDEGQVIGVFERRAVEGGVLRQIGRVGQQRRGAGRVQPGKGVARLDMAMNARAPQTIARVRRVKPRQQLLAALIAERDKRARRRERQAKAAARLLNRDLARLAELDVHCVDTGPLAPDKPALAQRRVERRRGAVNLHIAAQREQRRKPCHRTGQRFDIDRCGRDQAVGRV